TGRSIGEAAARRFLPVTLELGGKDPMIVLDDADIDVASSGAVWGAFMNAGQACLSVERCYVQRKVYEEFTQQCLRKAKQLRVGNGLDPSTDMGPMIHEGQLQVVECQLEEAQAAGAQILIGGRRLTELGGRFYAPTVLTNVNHSMRIMREETFGPVLPVMAFDRDEDAICLANDSEFGLGAGVWTGDQKRGENIARGLRAGTVLVNDVVSSYGISEAPHGGVKSSGIGRTHGRYGLEEMVRVKYVSIELLPGIKRPWWYAYGQPFTQQIEALLDMQFSTRLTMRVRGALRSAACLLKNQRL
ncbi:MAG: aldehyde dehydrogenase family protein, partial [Acidobacteria bacterium]|nr:aldehyde dehydrogenase family protein [Acidobacteriota bacterium]